MNIRNLAFSLPAASGIASMLCLTTGCTQSEFGDLTMVSNESQLLAEEKARDADPSWKPATEKLAVIQIGQKNKGGNLHNFCLNTNGNILACWGSSTASGKDPTAQIKVFSPDGNLLNTWPLPSTPEAICVDRDGTIFAGGGGRLLKLDQNGKVLASSDSPNAGKPVALDKSALESLAGRKLNGPELATYQDSFQKRKLTVTGLAVAGDDVFVAGPSASDFTYSVYRLDRDLKNPKLIVTGLRGCCNQMDVQAKDGKLWVPHNARHLVEAFDRDGKKLVSFGKTDRKAADCFGGCCEPKNLRLASDGNVYVSESGPPVAIKRFSPDGKFGGVIALPNFKSGCVRVTVEVAPDCKRFYILDTGNDAIHVFAAKN